MKNSNSVRNKDAYSKAAHPSHLRDRSLDLKISYGGLKAIDGLKLPQQPPPGYQSNSTTPKPPQLGGANYNPYREPAALGGGIALPSTIGQTNKAGKEQSPLATYDREQA